MCRCRCRCCRRRRRRRHRSRSVPDERDVRPRLVEGRGGLGFRGLPLEEPQPGVDGVEEAAEGGAAEVRRRRRRRRRGRTGNRGIAIDRRRQRERRRQFWRRRSHCGRCCCCCCGGRHRSGEKDRALLLGDEPVVCQARAGQRRERKRAKREKCSSRCLLVPFRPPTAPREF